MLVTEGLEGATVERAGALVAREQAAARQVRPELPAAFDSAEVCAAALQRLCDSGHHGLVQMDGRTCRPLSSLTKWTRRGPLRVGMTGTAQIREMLPEYCQEVFAKLSLHTWMSRKPGAHRSRVTRASRSRGRSPG